jgi:hypothetical protein
VLQLLPALSPACLNPERTTLPALCAQTLKIQSCLPCLPAGASTLTSMTTGRMHQQDHQAGLAGEGVQNRGGLMGWGWTRGEGGKARQGKGGGGAGGWRLVRGGIGRGRGDRERSVGGGGTDRDASAGYQAGLAGEGL